MLNLNHKFVLCLFQLFTGRYNKIPDLGFYILQIKTQFRPMSNWSVIAINQRGGQIGQAAVRILFCGVQSLEFWLLSGFCISLTMSAASATALAACISRPNCTILSHVPIWRSSSLRPQPSPTDIFFKIPCGFSKRSSVLTGIRRLSPVMEWQDCT